MNPNSPRQYVFDLSHLFNKDLMVIDTLVQICNTDLFTREAADAIPKHFQEHGQQLNHLLAVGYDVVVKVNCYIHESGLEIKFSITANEMYGIPQELEVMRRRGLPGYTGVYEILNEETIFSASGRRHQIPRTEVFASHTPFDFNIPSHPGEVLANQLNAYALTQIHPFNNDQRYAPLPQGMELLDLVKDHLRGGRQPASPYENMARFDFSRQVPTASGDRYRPDSLSMFAEQMAKMGRGHYSQFGEKVNGSQEDQVYTTNNYSVPRFQVAHNLVDGFEGWLAALHHSLMRSPLNVGMQKEFFQQVQEAFKRSPNVGDYTQLCFITGAFETLPPEIRLALSTSGKPILYTGWVVHSPFNPGVVPGRWWAGKGAKTQLEEMFAPQSACRWNPMSIKFIADPEGKIELTVQAIRMAYHMGSNHRGQEINPAMEQLLLNSIQVELAKVKEITGEFILTTECRDQLAPGLQSVITPYYQDWIIHTGTTSPSEKPLFYFSSQQ